MKDLNFFQRLFLIVGGVVAILVIFSLGNKEKPIVISNSTDIENISKDDWQQEFVNYRSANNKNVKSLVINQSVLYIYVGNLTRDLNVYTGMYTTQFQRAYQINTGGKRVSSLVYYNGKLIETINADDNGITGIE